MDLGSRLSWIAVVAAALLSVGCQRASTSDAAKSLQTWRVLERVGDVRAAEEGRAGSQPLRPGETISGGHRIVASRGSLVILAKGAAQLTAGENSILTLPPSIGPSELAVERGWVRIRLANAVDQEFLIKTDHFDISATNAMLTLTTGTGGSDLSVESGSVILATMGGGHHATLVAGAAAKMDTTSGNHLMIRPASGQDFAKVAPFDRPAERQDQKSGEDVSDTVSERVTPLPATVNQQPTETRPILDANASSSFVGDDTIIRPASRLKASSSNQPALATEVRQHPLPTSSPDHHAASQESSHPQAHPQQIIPSSTFGFQQGPTVDHASSLENQPRVPVDPRDPVQLKFDRLTDGLLENL